MASATKTIAASTMMGTVSRCQRHGRGGECDAGGRERDGPSRAMGGVSVNETERSLGDGGGQRSEGGGRREAHPVVERDEERDGPGCQRQPHEPAAHRLPPLPPR
jgi:hypothetical protein